MQPRCVLLTLVGMLGMAGCADEYEAEEFVGDEQANLLAENGEPHCVDDLCAVLDMYQDCVDEFPVTGDDEAQAALVERQCRDAGGECCDQGFYISPEAAACISENPGTPDLQFHTGYAAPIWMLTADTIAEVHAANGSVLSERDAPICS